MAASNQVEATLISKFQDGVSRGVEHTERVMAQAFASMRNGGAVLSSFMDGVWGSVSGGLENWRQRLQQAAEESNSHFGKIGLTGAAMAAGLVIAFAKAAKAAVEFVFDLAKSSSAAFEARMAFESLAGGGEKASAMLQQLKVATEGQVSGTLLMQNANRVLQSNVPLTSEMYAKLTENVFRLAKSAGTDGAQAIQTLTDAIIRGNARGFQAIGVHVAVKDAVTAMAEAQGISANRLGDESKLRGFYNEMLQKTNEALAKLGPQYLTVEDIVKQSQTTWTGLINSFGVAINRSGMLQEVMKRASEALLNVGAGEQAKKTTLAVNEFFLSLLRGLANAAETLGAFATAWGVVWGTIKLVINGAGAIITGVFAAIATGQQWLLDLFAKLPGAAGRIFVQIAEAARPTTAFLQNLAQEFGKGVSSSFDGFDSARQKLNTFANATRQLAGELERYKSVVVEGTAGLNQHGGAAANTAEQIKKLNEQIQKYGEIWKDLSGRSGNPQAAAQAQLFADFSRIDRELTLTGIEWDQKRNTLKLQALENYYAKLRELETKAADEENKAAEEKARLDATIAGQQINYAQAVAVLDKALGNDRIAAERLYQEVVEKGAKEREEQRQKEVDQVLSLANTLERQIDLVARGKLGSALKDSALEQIPKLIDQVRAKIAQLQTTKVLNSQQVEDLNKLYQALDRLNRLNMTPLQKMLANLKTSLTNMASSTTQAFGQFWAEMASGQENAGKRFLAALLDSTASELMVYATRQTAMAIACLADLDFAGAARHGAAAAGISALAGILHGMASNLTAEQSSTRTSSSSVSTASSSSSSSSSDVKVIEVGAPRGPQNPGEASAAQEPIQVHLKIDAEDGFVVRQVERNVKDNGRLRTVIQNA